MSDKNIILKENIKESLKTINLFNDERFHYNPYKKYMILKNNHICGIIMADSGISLTYNFRDGSTVLYII